jgi:hypothetical protein
LLAELGKDRKGEVKDAAIAHANRAFAGVQSADLGSMSGENPPKPMPDFEALARSTSYADQLLAVKHQSCPLQFSSFSQAPIGFISKLRFIKLPGTRAGKIIT